MSIVKDFEALPIVTMSDYLPIILYIESFHKQENSPVMVRILLNRSEAKKLTERMRWKDEAVKTDLSLDAINDNLIKAVTEVTESLGMKRELHEESFMR